MGPTLLEILYKDTGPLWVRGALNGYFSFNDIINYLLEKAFPPFYLTGRWCTELHGSNYQTPGPAWVKAENGNERRLSISWWRRRTFFLRGLGIRLLSSKEPGGHSLMPEVFQNVREGLGMEMVSGRDLGGRCLGVRWWPGRAAWEGRNCRSISKTKYLTRLVTELTCIRNDAMVRSQGKQTARQTGSKTSSLSWEKKLGNS